MKTIACTCFLFCTLSLQGQRIADPARRYTEAEVLDSVAGIQLYTLPALGGDSVVYGKDGRKLQGWNEAFYESGKLLHRGYYVNGQLITFKNFYDNGQCERAVESTDPLHCNIDQFFKNGNLRSHTIYYNGLPQKVYAYYENGWPRYAEENDKAMEYLTLKKSWHNNGNLESTLELVDRKNKKYDQKIYYADGHMKEEGPVVLLSGTHEYVKEGTWYSYDSSGKKHSEKHKYGIRLNSKQ